MPTIRKNVPAKRKTLWANAETSASPTATTGTVVLDLLAETLANYGLTSFLGVTVGRIIGQIGIAGAAENPVIAGATGRLGLGIALVDKDQVNVPDPLDDDYDWLWLYRSPQLYVRSDTPTAVDYPYLPEATSVQFIDNRSKRVIRQNHMKLVLIGQHVTFAAHEPQISAGFRTLIYLP